MDWGGADVTVLPLELTDDRSVRGAAEFGPDAVVHLAAVASNPEALADPGLAWTVNAAGTARLAEALVRQREKAGVEGRLLVVSSGEVYGPGPAAARRETDAVAPASPYAASKVGAELAGLEVWRRTGLPVTVTRSFTHTGPGQDGKVCRPSFAARLLAAEARVRAGCGRGTSPRCGTCSTCGMSWRPTSLLLRSVSRARSTTCPGVRGCRLASCSRMLAELIGLGLSRSRIPHWAPDDIPHLVGDPTKFRRATGWAPARTLQQTLRGLVDAEAD